MTLMSAPSMEGELKTMVKDTDKKKEAMTRIEMRISKGDKNKRQERQVLPHRSLSGEVLLEDVFRVMEIPHFYRNILCSLVRLVQI